MPLRLDAFPRVFRIFQSSRGKNRHFNNEFLWNFLSRDVTSCDRHGCLSVAMPGRAKSDPLHSSRLHPVSSLFGCNLNFLFFRGLPVAGNRQTYSGLDTCRIPGTPPCCRQAGTGSVPTGTVHPIAIIYTFSTESLCYAVA